MMAPTKNEQRIQQACLNAPIGSPGSALARYAAAMFFHQRGALSSKALEIYRTLAKDDHADPRAALLQAGCASGVDCAEIRREKNEGH